MPALNEYDEVEVLLDNVEADYEYGSSFLHEAFGGLVQHEKFEVDVLDKKLRIVTSYEDIKAESWDYIHAPDKYQ